LNAKESLELPAERARIRFLSSQEASNLADSTRRRNVFARHSWENNFYIQRIGELADTTVVEVLRPGDPDDMMAEARSLGDLLERLAVLSTTLAFPRSALHRALGITSDRGASVDFTFGRHFYYLRSTGHEAPTIKGIPVDGRFIRRFDRCGFSRLLTQCRSAGEMGRRLELSSRWLLESRQEVSLDAAFVKTAIALEALLIANQSEPLTRALSERSAFILSHHPERRHTISRNIKAFYSARSAVVHGSRRRQDDLPIALLEGTDRLVLLLCLVLAANAADWPSMEALNSWCEGQRWGEPLGATTHPFPGQYLTKTLDLFEKTEGASRPR
jgi:hypothetical protein